MDDQCFWHFSGPLKVKYQKEFSTSTTCSFGNMANTWQSLGEKGKVTVEQENSPNGIVLFCYGVCCSCHDISDHQKIKKKKKKSLKVTHVNDSRLCLNLI